MGKRELNTVCHIGPYRCDRSWNESDLPDSGHYFLTPSGSAYQILTARCIAGDAYRLKLTCLRIDPLAIPSAAIIHPLVWDKRSKRNKRSCSLDDLRRNGNTHA